MGKISATQRLIVEDFPDQKDWIGKMFYVVNDFFQKSLVAINGGLEFKENISGIEKEFDFIYVSHAASLPLGVLWTLAKPPRACQVVAAFMGQFSGGTVLSNKQLVPFICQVAWNYGQDQQVTLTDFTRITGSTSTVAVPIAGQRVMIRVRITP